MQFLIGKNGNLHFNKIGLIFCRKDVVLPTFIFFFVHHFACGSRRQRKHYYSCTKKMKIQKIIFNMRKSYVCLGSYFPFRRASWPHPGARSFEKLCLQIRNFIWVEINDFFVVNSFFGVFRSHLKTVACSDRYSSFFYWNTLHHFLFFIKVSTLNCFNSFLLLPNLYHFNDVHGYSHIFGGDFDLNSLIRFEDFFLHNLILFNFWLSIDFVFYLDFWVWRLHFWSYKINFFTTTLYELVYFHS